MRGLLAVALLGCVAAAAQDPATSGSEDWSGSVDIRNRFVSDIGGFDDVYRSVVNLGEGPRLYDAELLYRSPSNRYLDELRIDGGAWGGDPYNTAHLTAAKRGLYDFRFDYRALAYFNNLPSYANPLLQEGLLLSQRKIDLTRRNLDAELRLKPTSKISPFVAFYRSAGDGSGRTTFVANGNEFPVDTDLDDSLLAVRGGAKIQLRKWSLTLEQGRTSFSDRQAASFNDGGNPGNRRRPFLGRELTLDRLDQRYRADGSGLFSRAVFEARPAEWVGVSGQVLYSRPTLDVTQQLAADGVFVSGVFLAPFSGQTESSLGDASQPRSSASWNTALQPTKRLRIVQSWFTDRYHVASGATVTQLLNSSAFNTDPERMLQSAFVNRLVLDYNQHQVDAIYDLNRRFSIRGGHRYVWANAETPPPSLEFGSGARAAGETRRQVGLAGAALRPIDKLRVSVDFEVSPGNKTFFRTGLMDYRKTRAHARLKLSSELSVSTSFALLENRNDDPAINLDYRSRRTSVTVAWTPNSGPLSILADYTRSDIRSDIRGVQLPFFATELLNYRDYGNHGGAYVELALRHDLRLTAGGSYSSTSGSRPTRFYQPRAGAEGPLAERIRWKAEWRWYGFREELLDLENFRTHTLSAGFEASF